MGVRRCYQSGTCLHHLIVRMQQNGSFRDKAGWDDLISEFYFPDETFVAEAASEYEVIHN